MGYHQWRRGDLSCSMGSEKTQPGRAFQFLGKVPDTCMRLEHSAHDTGVRMTPREGVDTQKGALPSTAKTALRDQEKLEKLRYSQGPYSDTTVAKISPSPVSLRFKEIKSQGVPSIPSIRQILFCIWGRKANPAGKRGGWRRQIHPRRVTELRAWATD